MQSRMLGLRRALILSAALFATVFALLAVQLWLGRDPALGQRADGRSAQPQKELHASVLDTVLSVAAGVLRDGDDEDGDGQGPAVRSSTS